MPNTPPKACLLLCDDGSCRKKQARAHKAIRTLAKKNKVLVQPIACQGACTGPTAVVIDTKGPRWFMDLKSPKSHAQLIRSAMNAASSGKSKPGKQLKKRELTGRKRDRAARRFARQKAVA